MSERYDLVVVGAGPAGAAAAIRARQLRPDRSVLLLDRADFPRDKACGDGIAAHALLELATLDLPEVLAELHGRFPPVRRIVLRSPRGIVADGLAARANLVVPRWVFDAALVTAAVARGAHLRRCTVRGLRQDAAGVEVLGRAGEAFHAPVVIGADGAHSVVRRDSGAAPTAAAHLALAVRGYAPVPPGQPHAQYLWLEADGWPAYGWSFPIGDGTANVGFGTLVPRLRQRAAWARRTPRAELNGRLAAVLPDARPERLLTHPLPLSPSRPAFGTGRVLLAGDAASLINPLTGEGIYYALASGRMAAESVAGAAGRRGATDDHGAGRGAAADYTARVERAFGRHLRTTDRLDRLTQRAGFVDAAVAVASRRDEVFDLLVDIGLGNGTIPPALLTRVLARWLADAARGRAHGRDQAEPEV